MTSSHQKFEGTYCYFRVYTRLIEKAMIREKMTYSEVGFLIGIRKIEGNHHIKIIGELLGEISKHEHEHGRPMLSAVVVHKDDELPGDGFFELARSLKKLDINTKGNKEKELEFYEKELKEVYEYWGNQALCPTSRRRYG